MPTHTRDVHGHKVFGEDKVVKGMDYLDHGLEYAEAEVFFNAARNRGRVKFQDGERRNFTLRYNGDGTYTVDRRSGGGGFFSGWF